eukprot:632501-Prorocentrum_minimum.AAC.1
MQPRDGSANGGGGKGVDSVIGAPPPMEEEVLYTASEMLEQIPEAFLLADLEERVQDVTPFVTVALQ